MVRLNGLKMPRRIYLDAHATTPADPGVVAAMLPFMNGCFANPASETHDAGRQAAAAVARARRQVADLIGAAPEEVFFTSGATESNNLAIQGSLPDTRPTGARALTLATEHSAVLDPLHALQRHGTQVTVMEVTAQGHADPAAWEQQCARQPQLVSVMLANNEVGTIHPVSALARVARRHGAMVHCDGAQAVGHIPVDTGSLGVDLLSFSAHKFYGPKGVGALYVRGGIAGSALRPLLLGGGQEEGLRSGTLNVPGIVGMGRACRLAAVRMAGDMPRLQELRDRLEAALMAAIPGARVNGDRESRLPHNLSLTLPGVDAARLAAALPSVELSTGAACAARPGKPSHVLAALGLTASESAATLRFGLTRHLGEAEIDEAADQVLGGWQRACREG